MVSFYLLGIIKKKSIVISFGKKEFKNLALHKSLDQTTITQLYI